MELLFELLGWIAYAFFAACSGACFGVVWPAKTPQWARWQKAGIVLGLLSVSGFGAVWLVDGNAQWKRIENYILLASAVSLVGYLIVGNTIRKFHE